MENKEIAMHLTIAALNNQQIDTNVLPYDLKPEAIMDFYFHVLDKLDSHDEVE